MDESTIDVCWNPLYGMPFGIVRLLIVGASNEVVLAIKIALKLNHINLWIKWHWINKQGTLFSGQSTGCPAQPLSGHLVVAMMLLYHLGGYSVPAYQVET